MIFKVKPYCKRTGNFAPAIYVDAEDKDGNGVEEMARQKSGLARFINWNFTYYITKLRRS